jgi:hypothetical protein
MAGSRVKTTIASEVPSISPTRFAAVAVPILLLAGFFDGIADNWIHSLILWTVAVGVGADGLRSRGPTPPGKASATYGRESPWLSGWPRGWRLVGAVAAAVAGLAIYGYWGGHFQRYSWPETALIVVEGAGLLILAWRHPLEKGKPPPSVGRLSAYLWGSIFVGAGVWELIALLGQPAWRTGSYAHPTICYLIDPIISTPVGRGVAIALWAAVGLWLYHLAPPAPRRKTHRG